MESKKHMKPESRIIQILPNGAYINRIYGLTENGEIWLGKYEYLGKNGSDALEDSKLTWHRLLGVRGKE